MRTLLVERSAGVTTITLNRPEVRNAMNSATFDELRAVLDEAARNPDDRVPVLTGAGGAFCSGGDLTPVPGQREPGGAPPEPIPMMTLMILRDVGGAAALCSVPSHPATCGDRLEWI